MKPSDQPCQTAAKAGHHPVFEAYPPWCGTAPAGFLVNFLGVRIRTEFFRTLVPSQAMQTRAVATSWPAFDEEYFEWIDLLDAIERATNRFTMIELGAGYGRWTSCAAVAAARRRPHLPAHFVALEAEPQHFDMIPLHLRDNGLDPDDGRFELLHAAVAAQDGHVDFVVGHADQWYGHAIVRHGRMPRMPDLTQLQAQRVPAICLPTLLANRPPVDLIDLDIQGFEFDVLAAAASVLPKHVRCVHIGTHNAQVEQNLRRLFGDLHWTPRWDFPCRSTSQTPFGMIAFEDGVQTWLNPASI